ncbi:TlpA disulfide reductase family protein [Robertkochia aurantiaca]|uniref:TlpA disulfide reductase family protein n=1 Tax=Robertkochia aurantiaca TaxID=2873700 RepID=UPI001CCB9373|nr:TlpA disulfide reductase family protein [Robertkochia sp. 3YJGBD-33]
MKKIASILSLVTLIACGKAEKDQYTVSVNVSGIEDGKKAYLQKMGENNQPVMVDTLEVTNESFTFSGKATQPEMHLLYIEGVQGGLPFIIEEGNIAVTAYKDSINMSKIAGTPSNEDLSSFMANNSSIRQKVSDIRAKAMEAQRAGDTVTLNVLSETFAEVQEEAREYGNTFVKENPDSYVSLILLQQIIQQKSAEAEEIQTMYEAIDPELKKTTLGQQVGETIENLSRLSVGAEAPDFSGPTPDGDTLSLKASLGKVTILDFWAAWCKPCRAENPNLVALYKEYHDKGLNVVGVSLDRTKEAWEKAIEEDQLPWNHVSNLQFWQDPIARLYNITSIPATFILDEEGRIIAKDLRGEALNAKIEELLGS